MRLAYVECPVCKDPAKTIRMELLGKYEWDTGAGPFIEISDVECGCWLTADQIAHVDRAARELDMREWEPSDP